MFSVFPESENILLGISFSVPKFGKGKILVPGPVLENSNKKIMVLSGYNRPVRIS
jgi:hypothetical protein